MNNVFRRVIQGVCYLVLCVAFVACAESPRKQLSSVESAFNDFDRFQRSVVDSDPTARTLASRISDRYRAAFSPYQTAAAVSKLGNGDLGLLFRAAQITFFYGVSPPQLVDMQLDLAELSRRGAARDAQYADVYKSLIQIRNFDQAREFARLHPRVLSIERVPVLTDDGARQGPTALLVHAGGSKLERTSVDFRSGRHIVVVSSPLCHFSQRAVRSIEGDATLRPLFHQHAVWVVPPDQSTSFETIAEWNRLHPHEAMQVVYRREEWPMIDRWETPVFYFYRDGRVVGKVIGWPLAGRKAEVRRSLRLAGLLYVTIVAHPSTGSG